MRRCLEGQKSKLERPSAASFGVVFVWFLKVKASERIGNRCGYFQQEKTG